MYEEETAYEEEAVQKDGSQNANSEVEVEPVKFSKRKVWLILMGLLVLLLMVLLVVSQLSLTKNTKNRDGSSEPSQVESSVDLEVSSNSDESNPNLNESEPYIEESSSAPSEGNNTEDISGIEVEATVESTVESIPESEVVPQVPEVDESIHVNSVFEDVITEPAMGAEVTTSGMVSGMGMYKYGNSYTYGVSIILVTGNDSSVECQYFCPRNTYSALEVGDPLNVIYQMDSQGNVSISSISK